MPETSTELYQAAIRREQDRRNPHRVIVSDGVVIPMPPLRRTPFTGTAGL
jgi:hypothetical protein